MKAGPIIDEREGETEDEARERHARENASPPSIDLMEALRRCIPYAPAADPDLTNARAAIAQVDRVLETGTARANGYREAARRLRGVVASSVVMLRRRFPCTDALTGTLPALINHAARDVELSEQYERRLAEVERLRAEVDCGQEGVCAKPPGCARHWQERNQELASEVAKLKERSEGLQQAGADLTLRLLGLEKERDEALASSRAWCEKAAELQAERDYAVETLANAVTSKAEMGDRLTRERDSAVARAQDLEAGLEWVRNCAQLGPCPSIRSQIDTILHPSPPASASDRAGTEHHDAADPEDGCQAGARRP